MSFENLSDAELFFKLFDLPNEQGEYHVAQWPLYRCPEAISLIKARAASYRTLPSVSGFIRAFEELKREGAIKPVRSADPLKVEPSLTVAEYHKLPASQIVARYRSDKKFHDDVDALIAQGLI